MKEEILHNINQTGFIIPHQYFGSLEDAVLCKLAEDNLAFKVSSTGYKVPEDYFESFDSKVLKEVNSADSVKVVSLFSWKKIAFISGVAASIILAFNILFTNSEKLTFDSLETASIENYLKDEDLNAYDIAPYLGSDTLDSDDFVDNTLNASDIEDYLLINSDIEHLITD